MTADRRPPASARAVATFVAATLALAAGAVAGCGDEPTSFELSHAESGEAPPTTTDADASAGAAMVRTLAQAMGPGLRTALGDGSLVWSPLATTSALAQLRTGATGGAATAIDQLLGVDGNDPSFDATALGATETARRLAGPVSVDGEVAGPIVVDQAVALWGRSGTTWSPTLLDRLAQQGASMWMADWAQDRDRATADVNRWTAERTDGQAPQVLATGQVADDDRLVVTAAVGFSAPWAEPMALLARQPFTDADGADTAVPFLVASGRFERRQGAGWEAVTVPYVGDAVALTLVSPSAPTGSPVTALDAALDALVQPGEAMDLSLRFPQFSLDTTQSGPALNGNAALFEPSEDFAGMTVDEQGRPVAVDAIGQQATIAVGPLGTSVADQGTDGAADAPDGDDGAEPWTVDHPFAFVVHDTAHGLPILAGWVLEAPTSG